MRGTAIWLLVFGIGSFILPMMGAQFFLLSLFGQYTAYAGALLTLAGIIMLALSFRNPG